MMVFQAASAHFFYDFYLDDHVPADHMLRGIDRHLKLGRSSVNPKLMMPMLIISYSMGIRSER